MARIPDAEVQRLKEEVSVQRLVVAPLTPAVPPAKSPSHDFGKMEPAFLNWRHTISTAQPCLACSNDTDDSETE